MAEAPVENGEEVALPPSLRFLKALVIILMLCMIAGVIAVSLMLVTRLRIPPGDEAAPGPAAALPQSLSLPAGETPASVIPGRDWIGVVTDSDRILIFNKDGSLRQEIAIAPAP
ncbi:hypothetical protein HOY34_17095 [Xinfangfangia sp. D13-10-4-6]|uniref:DUF6476 family protein n=1 Tax=Pseudogemmobacter hezensis TaxID=2737662 RepID=UPI0015565744|nr:DUF6476 family protein [Pseudogemmobacter hezensis]NPD16912.1 hypothetical protein [Pseudogemmobacter hezensis]